MSNKNKGWHGESRRHGLARKGIRTSIPASDFIRMRAKGKLIKRYKGYRIEDSQGVIVVVSDDGTRFIVALDDSKRSGSRRHIEEYNNVESAEMYIDWITRRRDK